LTGDKITAGAASPARPEAAPDRQRRRREFAVLLLAGTIGAGLVLLSARQEFARVEVVPLHPLPVTVTKLSGQDLLPAASALALAALASMAAVLATRGLLRRATGAIAALLGAGIALTALGRISKASVLAAVSHAGGSSPTGAGAGSAPGSTTVGTDPGLSTGSLAGFPSHVLFTGSGWRALMVIGAVIVVVAGLAVIVRAGQLPVMSTRYDQAGKQPRPQAVPASPAPAGASGPRALLRSTSSAHLWESLSAGADPTSWSGDE
jgi:uncharacterized membrane protein (TIGR02234 family)